MTELVTTLCKQPLLEQPSFFPVFPLGLIQVLVFSFQSWVVSLTGNRSIRYICKALTRFLQAVWRGGARWDAFGVSSVYMHSLPVSRQRHIDAFKDTAAEAYLAMKTNKGIGHKLLISVSLLENFCHLQPVSWHTLSTDVIEPCSPPDPAAPTSLHWSYSKTCPSENLIMQARQLPVLSCSQHSAWLWKLNIISKNLSPICLSSIARMQGKHSNERLLQQSVSCSSVLGGLPMARVLSLQHKHVSEHAKSH